MSRRPAWKRVVDGLAFLLLALAAAAMVISLINAKTGVSVVFRLGFLALFVSGLFELVRMMRRSWASSARD